MTDGHQAGHFDFSDLNFLAAPIGKIDVGADLVVVALSTAIVTAVINGVFD